MKFLMNLLIEFVAFVVVIVFMIWAACGVPFLLLLALTGQLKIKHREDGKDSVRFEFRKKDLP